MAWNAPVTFIDEELTAEQLNAMLVENMNEAAPAKATDPAHYFVSEGANSIVPRKPVEAFSYGEITVSSTSFVSSDGPVVTVDHGEELFVVFSSRIWTTSGQAASCDPRLTGDNDIGPTVTTAFRWSGTRSDLYRGMSFKHYTGLTPGTTTVELEYVVTSGSASFAQRRMCVWPL